MAPLKVDSLGHCDGSEAAMESDSQHAPAAETVNTYAADQRTQNSGAWDSCYIYSRIGEILKFLASKGVGLGDACTDGAGRTCWLCWNTTPWNRLLAPLSLELVVSGPGEHCLRPIDVGSRNNDTNARCDGAFVFAWLLKQHRCVKTVHLESDVLFRMPRYWLKLALNSSANLRHLKLVGDGWKLKNFLETCELLESLVALESFEFCKLKVTPVLASSIAALLRRNKGHLVKVNFANNPMSQRSMATLLSALIGCRALTELSFMCYGLKGRNVKTMARVVRAARQLKQLSLHWSLGSESQWGSIGAALKDHTSLEELSLRVEEARLGPVFEALETNTTLRHLYLQFNCRFRYLCRPPRLSSLANLLCRNRGLRHVVLRYCTVCGNGTVCDNSAQQLADAIMKNSTLETLDLSTNSVGIQGISAFCAALRKNKTLKTVSFSYHPSYLPDGEDRRRGLARLLYESGCYGRIVVPMADPDLPPLTVALALASQSPTKLSLGNINKLSSTLLCELFDVLASNTEVKILQVEADVYEADKADALCRALAANQSIKRLEVRVDIGGPCKFLIEDIAKALIVNTSVTDLIIRAYHTRLVFFEAFARMLTQNKTLTTISLRCKVLGSKHLEILSQGMLQNRVVTSFAIDQVLPRNRAAFRLHEAVRRNTALLNMAALFVLQADVTKRCAQAFETLRWTSSLVSQVAKVSGQSEQEAAAALDAADGFIRSRFLFVTGVVREAVRCHPGSATQADSLNDYCWQAIAEYLKVSDVRDGQ
ncbi:hypothetical protein HPB48_005973 [Haemaphysalis longicornis]|uniref:Ran GTPase-activating protein n=1 Tax=Haemaphysalis longicornis TaxID=44386 RepID=A0A9J6FB35_HAELO|nr:hypothetical protein HPB48_005973 [Haemaphysalis longicornis]